MAERKNQNGKNMFDKTAKNVVLLRHGKYDIATENINWSGFIEALFIAKYLKDNKFPLPSHFIAFDQRRANQMAKIISSSLTRKKLPILQEPAFFADARVGIMRAVSENNLDKSNFLIVVSHLPAIEELFKHHGIDHWYINTSDTFLLNAPTWKDMLTGNGLKINKLISPSLNRFETIPGVIKIRDAFEAKAGLCEMDKIPILLEYMRNNQELRKIMMDVLNPQVKS